LLTLADAMFNKHFNKGESIIRFGDIGSEYFILSAGVVSVTVYQPGSNPFDPKLTEKITIEKELSSEPNMIGFGEIALLLNDRRTASITAKSPEGCDTWVLAADVFKHIIASNTLRRRNINLTYLSQVQLFKNIEQYEKLRLIDGLKIEQYFKDQFVFKEGDVGSSFYIIEEGECECLKSKEDGGFELVRKLEVGAHFGEIALLKNVKRTLSVKATS
jgi:cAMP-dependent protein kinase regulator